MSERKVGIMWNWTPRGQEIVHVTSCMYAVLAVLRVFDHSNAARVYDDQDEKKEGFWFEYDGLTDDICAVYFVGANPVFSDVFGIKPPVTLDHREAALQALCDRVEARQVVEMLLREAFAPYIVPGSTFEITVAPPPNWPGALGSFNWPGVRLKAHLKSEFRPEVEKILESHSDGMEPMKGDVPGVFYALD